MSLMVYTLFKRLSNNKQEYVNAQIVVCKLLYEYKYKYIFMYTGSTNTHIYGYCTIKPYISLSS